MKEKLEVNNITSSTIIISTLVVEISAIEYYVPQKGA